MYRGERANGSLDFLGLFVGVGRAEADVDRVYGGKGGDLSMSGYSFGGYWTILIILAGTLTLSFREHVTIRCIAVRWTTLVCKQQDRDLSPLEGGYCYAGNDGWTVEFQNQRIYQHVSLDDTSDQFGQISFASNNIVYGRIGAKVSRDWKAEDGRR